MEVFHLSVLYCRSHAPNKKMSLELINVIDDSFLNQKVLWPAQGISALEFILKYKKEFIGRPSLVGNSEQMISNLLTFVTGKQNKAHAYNKQM